MFIGSINNILPILSGCVFMYNFKENIERDKIRGFSFGRIFLMSISLYFFGVLMNAMTWGFWYSFSWNILQLVAVSIMVIFLLSKYLSIHAVTVLSLLVFFLAEPLRVLFKDYDHIYLISIWILAPNAKQL